ncbi:MAG TPA: hypothetical protein VK866_16850, partial [Acidimicrobiales bacterium]|nr:hypothetical protein [Acidimicrobiales bacterium]
DGTPGARPAPGERLADDTPAGGPQGDGTSVGAGAPAMAAVDDLDARTDALAGAEPMGTSSGDGSGTDPAMGGYEDGAGVMVAPRASAAMADLERAADGAVVDPAHLVAGLQGMAAEAAVGCVRAADPAGDGPLAELAGRLDRAGDALARGDHAVGVEHLDGAVMVAERLVAATAADAVDDDARVAHDRCAEAVEHRGAGDHDAATRCEQEAAEAYERAAMRTEERMVETAEALAGPEAGAEVRDGVMTAMRGHGGDELAEAATCYREAAARARDGDAEGAMAHDREALVHLARGRAELSAAVDEGRLGPELVEAMGGYPPAMDGPPPGEAADRVERDPLEALDVDGPPPGETADTAMADASERPGEETMAGAYDRSGGGGPDGRGPGDDSSMAFGQGAAPAAAAMAPGAGSPSMPDPPGTPDPAPMRDPMGMPDPMDPAAAMPPMTEPAGWEADEAPMDAGPDPMDVMDG